MARVGPQRHGEKKGEKTMKLSLRTLRRHTEGMEVWLHPFVTFWRKEKPVTIAGTQPTGHKG